MFASHQNETLGKLLPPSTSGFIHSSIGSSGPKHPLLLLLFLLLLELLLLRQGIRHVSLASLCADVSTLCMPADPVHTLTLLVHTQSPPLLP